MESGRGTRYVVRWRKEIIAAAMNCHAFGATAPILQSSLSHLLFDQHRSFGESCFSKSRRGRTVRPLLASKFGRDRATPHRRPDGDRARQAAVSASSAFI